MWERPKLENGRFKFIEEFGDMVIVSSDENGRINISCFRPKTNIHRPLLITTEQAAWLGAQLSDYAATGVLRDLTEVEAVGLWAVLSDKDAVCILQDGEMDNVAYFSLKEIETAQRIANRVNAIIQSKDASVAEPAPEVVPGMWRVERLPTDRWRSKVYNGEVFISVMTNEAANAVIEAHNAEAEQAQTPVRESGAVEKCFVSRGEDVYWASQEDLKSLRIGNEAGKHVGSFAGHDAACNMRDFGNFILAIVRGGEVG